MKLRILHIDYRRCVLTCEVAGIRRHWTPLQILTLQQAEHLKAGGEIEIVP